MALQLTAFAVFDGTDAPLTTATPVFAIYKSMAGSVRTPPAISNMGGGLYGFAHAQADYDVGTAFLVSTGAQPSHYAGAVGALANAFAIFDAATGSPSASASPVFTRYVSAAGVALSAPSIVNLGGGLYGFTIASSDAASGVAFEIDNGAGFEPRYLSGVGQRTAEAGLTTIALPPPPATVPAPAPGSDIIRSFLLTDDGDLYFDGTTLHLASGVQAINQAIRGELQLFQGEWFLDLDAGVPYFERVTGRNPNVPDVKSLLRSTIEGVLGVKSVTSLDVTLSPTREIRVTYAAQSDVGALAGAVEVPL
jgi:hypothetical protein